MTEMSDLCYLRKPRKSHHRFRDGPPPTHTETCSKNVTQKSDDLCDYLKNSLESLGNINVTCVT